MEIVVITPPEAEPISLFEAHAWLRLNEDEASEQSVMLGALVTAARERVEKLHGRALGRQTLQLVLDRWPRASALPLPRPPLVEVTEVRYAAPDGTDTVMTEGEDYTVYQAGQYSGIEAVGAWPETAGRPGAVAVSYKAGSNDPPTEMLRLAMRFLIEYWYDREGGPDAPGDPAVVLNLCRRGRYAYRLPK